MLGIALAAVLAASAAAFPQSAVPLPVTGELQVNQAVAGNQEAPAAGMREDGVHVVVWQSAGQDASGSAIVVRHFPADGSQPANESVLNELTAGDQFAPAVSMNASGDWFAVWDTATAAQGLRGRATTGGGTVVGSELQASVSTNLANHGPIVSRADDGNSAVAWTTATGVAFRRFDATNAPLIADNSGPSGYTLQDAVALGIGPLGGAIFGFQAFDGNQLGPFVQRYRPNSTLLGGGIEVAALDSNSQESPDIDAAGDGSFVVTWVDDVLGLRARCFDADGLATSGELAVHPAASAPAGAPPQVAVNASGAFVVVFQDGADSEIRAREYDRLCLPIGAAFDVAETTLGTQARPSAAAGGDRFVVAWETDALDGNGLAVARRLFRFRSIFTDRFESGGTAGWSVAVP